MILTETVLIEYVKKIYGFAYDKTHDSNNAEDLAQEILCELAVSMQRERQIACMDAYIYRVCRYTFAKYLQKNKQHWTALIMTDSFDMADDSETPEEALIQSELYARLRREIGYLGYCRREALILFYYEGKSGEEISRQLNLSPATVRWHLSKAKNELKERMEMKEQKGIYRPHKLNIGLSGWENNAVIHMLETDILM